MNALQTVCLLAVAIAGTATIFGLALSVLSLAVAAPDVALSQLVVAGVAVPVMVLLALAKIRTVERAQERGEDEP